MELLRIKLTLTQNGKVYPHVTAKNDTGQIIYGLAPAVAPEEVSVAISSLVANMATTQDHVANTEEFGTGHAI